MKSFLPLILLVVNLGFFGFSLPGVGSFSSGLCNVFNLISSILFSCVFFILLLENEEVKLPLIPGELVILELFL